MNQPSREYSADASLATSPLPPGDRGASFGPGVEALAKERDGFRDHYERLLFRIWGEKGQPTPEEVEAACFEDHLDEPVDGLLRTARRKSIAKILEYVAKRGRL